MQELRDLELLLKSHTPIVVIESQEEPRIVQLFTRLALQSGDAGFQWTVTDGLRRLEADFPPLRDTSDPKQVLTHIRGRSEAGLFLMLDFHPYLSEPVHVRLIKEIAQGHEQIARTLVFVSHGLDIPAELRHLSARFELHLPDRAGIVTLINEEAQLWERRTRQRVRANREAIKLLSQNLLGVTASDSRRLIRQAIQRDGAITHDDLPELMRAKYELMGRDGVVSFEHDTTAFSNVAGLRGLKQWLEHRKPAFRGESGALDRPKGIMLLGVQGGGKSLAAKSVAGHFGVPLLRLDFGVLYDKYIGETEKNLRHALRTAEVMAPCVLWMDEIEKGISPGDGDDGVSRRVLGTLLTWMAERKDGVFIVATANDIQRLPPELLRKGRLDEIFFVDLPDADTRKAVFSIHLRSRNLAPSGFDLEALADASAGFTGAGIEQVLVSALYAARAQNAVLKDQHILEELERTQPLSVVMAERIEALRAWARDRTVPAD